MTERVFVGAHVRCSASGCTERLEGQPIRHYYVQVGAGSSWGPACEEHENWYGGVAEMGPSSRGRSADAETVVHGPVGDA